jgi:hypothetical protein
MHGRPPPPVSEVPREVRRAVALTYRRVDRAAKAEGCRPPEQHRRAYEAAHAMYLRLDPDAPADRLKASAIVTALIAQAIRANTSWFWEGPDA